MVMHNDEFWMHKALQLASKAAAAGEVPVGAVLVQDQAVIGEGFNQPILNCDPSAHAEIIALRHAGDTAKNYRLPNTTLYVTLEPCSMCAGAIVHARVERLVYAASEPKAGVGHSQQCFFEQSFLNHKVEVVAGVLEQESSDLIKQFFKQRRDAQKAEKLKLNSDI